MNTDRYLTVKEAAEYLRVSERTVRRWAAENMIPSVKIGGARRVRVPDNEGGDDHANTDRH